MSFFAKLFKAKQPETLEQRIAGLNSFDQSQLLQTAQAEEPDALRHAAIKKLAYSQGLLELATRSSNAGTQNAARRRIGELLDAGSVTVEQLSQQLSDHTILLTLCGYSTQAGVSLVGQIDNQDLLMEVAQNGSTTQMRQAASQKIEGREQLEALYKQAKNKDKSVYKIVKGKLDLFKEEKAKEAKRDEEISQICHQAEQLAKRNVDDIFLARKTQVAQAWESLAANASPSAASRFHDAMNKCQAKLDEIAENERLQQAKIKAEVEAKKELHSALDSMRALLKKLFEHHQPEQLKLDLQVTEQKQSDALKEAQQRGLDTREEAQLAEKLKKVAQQLLSKLEKHGALPELLDKLKTASDESAEKIKHQVEDILHSASVFRNETMPDAVKQGQALVSEWSEKFKEQVTERTQWVKHSGDLLRKGNWAISNGHVGRARAIFRDLEESIKKLDKIPGHIETKFEEFKLSIEKLGDWHEFAVTPKKEALVREMQQLKTSELHPKDLAEKIHTLQNNWKELCRGGQNQDEELWQAFHSAAQEAYEPCKVHFEEQNQIREENSAKRKTLIQQLNEYIKGYDWDAANWPEVEKTLKISRDAWQSYWPVARKELKTLQGQFDAVMDALHGKINSEYEHNKAKKESIVNLAAKLSDMADTSAAIESAKNLQQQWRVIGRCKRKDDQQLWGLFRQHCDAVFERRNQESESNKKEREINKQQALDLLTKLHSIATLDGEAFFAAKGELDTLTDAFQQVGELPRDDARKISEQYQSALAAIERRTDEIRKQSALSVWQNLFLIANELRELELEPSASDEQLSKIEGKLHDLERCPGDTAQALEQRICDLKAQKSIDSNQSLQRLKLLCIKAEVARGVESPASDKALRMEYQVKQLQQGFGQAGQSADQIQQQLTEEWLSIPGVTEPDYSTLLSRFNSALKA